MITKVHSNRNLPGNSNQGSSKNLIDYLEKEQNSLENNGFFFGRTKDSNQFRNDITRSEAFISIDENTKGLRKTDSKFFMITLNLSEKEQKHLARKVSGKSISSISELSKKEKKLYEKNLQQYTKNVMDIYAKNFNRGITEKDLVYVAKIEHERRYKGYEEAVEKGRAKSGDKKKGLHTHVHIVVSRKDKTQSLSLSPNAIEKIAKSNHVVNGKQVTKGFNHELFKLKSEQQFSNQFNMPMTYDESYQSKSSNPALTSISNNFKKNLTPKEYKNLASLSDANLKLVYSFFTNPSKAVLGKLTSIVKNEINLVKRMSQQSMREV